MSENWFDVDKKGLARQAKERGAPRVFLELVANALDEHQAGMTEITLQVTPIPGRSLADVVVEDNSPAGFCDLSHAHTLFADSYKRGNPEQRGQFNLGEKMFLSLCRTANISTTTGTVEFVQDGGRKEHPKRKRKIGTRIEAVYEITRDEVVALDHLVESLLLPGGVSVSYNGRLLECRTPLKEIEATLPTMQADADNIMRPTIRRTKLRVYEARSSEQPYLYELGIPVVEVDIRWHVSVGQKVPLNRDRDNVTPAYYRKVCTAVAEAMRDELTAQDANTWGNAVLADKDALMPVVQKLMDERFGQDRASYDPNDPEANIAGAAKGATIVTGRMLSKEQWENVKEKGLIAPAGKRWPTPKPWSDDPNAPPAVFLEESELSDGMRNVRAYAVWLAKELLGVNLTVKFAKEMGTTAAYSRRGPNMGVLEFNVQRLGRNWFSSIAEKTDELLIHELAHHEAGVHYSDEYHEACCRLGARLKRLALNQPKGFAAFQE